MTTATEPKKTKRSRSGCLTCRGRHKKCDEIKPVCRDCQIRGARCEWPTKNSLKQKNPRRKKDKMEFNVSANYHEYLPTIPFNSVQYTPVDYSLIALSDSPESSDNQQSSSLASHGSSAVFSNISPEFVSDTSEELENKDSEQDKILNTFQRTNITDITQGVDIDSAVFAFSHEIFARFMEIMRIENFGESHKDHTTQDNTTHDYKTKLSNLLKELDSVNDSSSPLNDFGSFIDIAGDFNLAPDSHLNETVVKVEEKLVLVQHFIANVMPLLRVHSDSSNLICDNLTKILAKHTNTVKTKTDSHVICSILCLSSRLISLKDQRSYMADNKQTLRLYNKSLRLMIESSLNEVAIGTEVLLSCVLSFFFEYLTIPSRMYRKALADLLLFARSYNMTGFHDDPLISQIFWLLARIDLTMSLCLEEPPIMKASIYLPKNGDPSTLFSAENHCEKLCYLAAKSLELIYNCKGDDYSKKWSAIIEELDLWHTDRPLEIRSVVNDINADPSRIQIDENTSEMKVPTILYGSPVATFSTQLYHIIQILLNKNQGTTAVSEYVKKTRPTSLGINAIKVVGTFLNDIDIGSLTFSLGLQCAANSVLKDIQSQSYYYNNSSVKNKLLKNARRTSWPVNWKLCEL